jgi:hypothetical protein
MTSIQTPLEPIDENPSDKIAIEQNLGDPEKVKINGVV